MSLKFKCESSFPCERLRELAERYLSRVIALDKLQKAKLPRIAIREGELSGVFTIRSRKIEIAAPLSTPMPDLLWLLIHELAHWRMDALGGSRQRWRELEEYEAEERTCDIEAGRASGLPFSPLFRLAKEA